MTESRRAGGARLRRKARPGSDGERGASSIELVMYTPILMLVIFLTVQFALSWHGNQVAGAVAREAARIARTGGGTPESLVAARTSAIDYAAAIGGNALTEVDVEIVVVPLPGNTIRATVSGRSVEIVEGFAPLVRKSVEGPIEEFRSDQ